MLASDVTYPIHSSALRPAFLKTSYAPTATATVAGCECSVSERTRSWSGFASDSYAARG